MICSSTRSQTVGAKSRSSLADFDNENEPTRFSPAYPKSAGRGTALRQTTAAAKKSAQLAGYAVPGLNIFMGLLTLNDIAGPAYRKTVPTVIELALLRMLHSGAN